MTGDQTSKTTQRQDRGELLSGFDHVMLRFRPFVFAIFILVLLGDLLAAATFPTNFPILTAVELALAVGTLALAYAAYLQVASSVESRKEEERWRAKLRDDRAKDREPNLAVGMRYFPRTKMVASTDPSQPPGTRVAKSFDAAELYIENVGPGVAANVRVTQLRLYVDYDPRLKGDPDNPDPFSECLNPKELVKVEHSFEFSELSLTSPYLPVGPQNRTLLLNVDDSEDFSWSERFEMDRMYIVTVEYTDLEGKQLKRAVGGASREMDIPDAQGVPWDPFEDEHAKSSRWYLARSDTIQTVLADWNLKKKTS